MSGREIDEGLDRGVRVWVVVGDAPLLVDRQVASLVAWGLARCGPPSLNRARFDAAEHGAGVVFSAARTLPMMSDLRLVEVRGLEAADDGFFEALVKFVAEASNTLLVCSGSGFPKVKKGGTAWGAVLAKRMGPQGRLVKVNAQDLPPERFVREHASAQGKAIDGEAARLVVQFVGSDLSVLAREVEKLAMFVGDGKAITPADVHAATSLLAEAAVWDLTTGIAARDPKMALTALQRLLDDGDASHRLIALVLWQTRQILQVAEGLTAGLDDGAIHLASGLRPDQVSRLRRALGSARPPDAATLLGRVAQANLDMNSHRAGDRRVFESLVLDLCSR